MRVEAAGLSIKAGDRTLFSALDFEWTGPRLIAVVGPSGSGKSTLLSALMGWTRPTEGQLAVLPTRSAWLVPQNAPLLDSRTVRENLEVALMARAERPSSDRSVDQTLTAYRLEDRANIRGKYLSGGERQRVALARADLRRPEILLADEVTAGLDPLSVEMVTDSLRELSSHALVVVATHDERVWSAADEVLDLTVRIP